MAKEIPGECAHEPCQCPVPAGQRYCSEHCATQDAAHPDKSADAGCHCGHPACHSDG